MSERTLKTLNKETQPAKKFRKWVDFSNVIVYELQDGSREHLKCGSCGSTSDWMYPMAAPAKVGQAGLAVCNNCGFKPESTVMFFWLA